MTVWVYMVATRAHGGLLLEISKDMPGQVSRSLCKRGELFSEHVVPRNVVWCEAYSTWAEAQTRRQMIQSWPRRWQQRLVDAQNPGWSSVISLQ